MIRTETPTGSIEWALLDEGDIERLAREVTDIPEKQAQMVATASVSLFEARLNTSADGFVTWLHTKVDGSPHHVVERLEDDVHFLSLFDHSGLLFFFEALDMDANTCLVWGECCRPSGWGEYLDLVRRALELFGVKSIARLPANRAAACWATDRRPGDENPPAVEPATRILLPRSARRAKAPLLARIEELKKQAEDERALAREDAKKILPALLALEKTLAMATPKLSEGQQSLPEPRNPAEAQPEPQSGRQPDDKTTATGEIPDDLDCIPDDRDREIIRLWRQGHTSGQIAEEVSFSEQHMRNEITRLRKQYGKEIVPYHR